MRLHEFYSQVRNAGPDVRDFELLLAFADPVPGDDVDVQLVDVGWLEVDYDANHIRLYPRSAVTEDNPDQQIPTLEVLLQMLPFELEENAGLELVAELPFDREPPGLIRKVLAEVHAVHLGTTSREAWLLLNPKEAYAKDVLPA